LFARDSKSPASEHYKRRKEVLKETKTIGGVAEFMAQYVVEVIKKRQHNKTWKKVYGFSEFAGTALEVFKQAGFAPECPMLWDC
jgi:hypothetical protein